MMFSFPNPLPNGRMRLVACVARLLERRVR